MDTTTGTVSVMAQTLLGDVSDKLSRDAFSRIEEALNAYLVAKSPKEDALLDVVLPLFTAAGIERARAFRLLEAAEGERKARRKTELELKAQERAAKKAAKGGLGLKASGGKKSASTVPVEDKSVEGVKVIGFVS